MKLIFLFLFAFYSFISTSQNTNVVGFFPTIDHSGSLTNKLEYGIYYFGAFPFFNLTSQKINNSEKFKLIYLEHSLTYNFTKNLYFTGSYLFQKENVLGSNYVNENRFYGQLRYKQIFPLITLSHRLRYDARFIENRITNQHPFTGRIRYLIGLEKSLSQNLYFSAYEELFFSTSKNVNPIYNENWAYTGIGKKISENNKIEMGILYVSWNLGYQSWLNQFYGQITWINHLSFCNDK